MDFFSFNFLGDFFLLRFIFSFGDVYEIVVSDFFILDENFEKMENVFDFWSLGFKVL